MDKYSYNLWGMYPVPNYYFMKNEISTNLKFCIGRVFGFNNTKDVICGDDCRDDYERSILYYVRDGGIIRFNNYVCDACCILYDFNQTINDNNLDIGKELSNFNIIEHDELSKLINQQKYLMKKIENIKQQIKTPSLL